MSSGAWPGLQDMDTAPTALFDDLFAVTLFSEDLPASRAFYGEVLGLPFVFSDDHSAVFRVGATLVNLLQVEQADELVTPSPVAGPGQGARAMFTAHVDDVDATVAELARRGVTVLNAPVDRPWGPRTAAFADPGGNVWGVAGPAR